MNSHSWTAWIDEIAETGTASKPSKPGDMVKTSEGKPFGVIEFIKYQKTDFIAELGKKGNHYIYHFFPSAKLQSGTKFKDSLSDVLLALFKREDQIELDWVPEMKAWAVRISGWVDNIWGDDLADRAIHNLDTMLKEI